MQGMKKESTRPSSGRGWLEQMYLGGKYRAYSGNTKQIGWARIHDVYKEVVRVSLESLYVLPKNEWQVEESAINFANKKILQKFSNNRFM